MYQNNQQLIKASVIIVIIAGVLGALSIFTGGLDASSAKLFCISFILILFGITGTISFVVTGKPQYKALGTAGMVVSAITFLLFFIVILTEVADTGIFQLGFCLMIASIALAHICLLHHFNLQNKYALYARMTATSAIAIFSLILIVKVFEPFPSLYSLGYNQSALKLLVAALVIDLAATLLVPLCNRLKVEEPIELTFTTEENPPATSQEEQNSAI